MSANPTAAGSGFNLATAAGRADLVREIRGIVSDHFKADWQRRGANVAGFALHALRTQGMNLYRVACGRVVETPQATAKTGKPPETRYEGFLSPTGVGSEYHVWLVADATGHKIDCCELPVERYGHSYLWEPGETVPELDYIEKAEVTAAMSPRIMSKYGL